MRLIYRCGRFQNLGYATIFSDPALSESDRADTDNLWQSAQRGEENLGCTSISHRLAAEGREITEVLIFHHRRSLTPSQEAALLASLDEFFQFDLANAVESSRGLDNVTIAKSILEATLVSALPKFSQIIETAPTLHDPSLLKKIFNNGIKRQKITLTIAMALIFMAIVFTARFLQTNESNPTASLPVEKAHSLSDNTKQAIGDFLTACYGELSPETADKIVARYAGKKLKSHDNGRRDRLQMLDNEQRTGFLGMSITSDKEMCEYRSNFWKEIDDYRKKITTDTDQPFVESLQGLEKSTADFRLTSISQAIFSLPPPPDRPVDCAEGYCLPIIDPIDIEALEWINVIYATITSKLTNSELMPKTDSESFLKQYGKLLRQAEVDFRGEVDLMGVGADRPVWLEHIWKCEKLLNCEVPLLDLRDGLMD